MLLAIDTATQFISLALHDGHETRFHASTLMKFGPLVGDRLARSVLDGRVHPDLTCSA